MKSCEGEHKYAEVFRKGKEQCTQTETIFGLKDLPTVTEIVNNKIQEKKTKDETETAGRANLKNIFVSPLPTLFYWYGSVSRKLIFFN